jgi:hypothetical protein
MQPAYDCDCDCDRILEMEKMGLTVEEILQYAKATLPRKDVRTLILGLEQMLAAAPVTDQTLEERARALIEA